MVSSKYLLKLLTIFCALFLVACGGEDGKDASTAAPSEGAKIVKAECKVCHAQGINGAPIIGNKKMWKDRLPQGQQVLTQHAIEGFGLMPPKGGKTHLSDEQIGLAVEFMIQQVQ